MAKKDEAVFEVGSRISVVEKKVTYEGTVTSCNPDETFDVKFDIEDTDGCDEGQYDSDGMTLIVPEPEPEIEEDEVEDTIVLEQTMKIPKSKVTISSNIAAHPLKLAAEEERQTELQAARKKNRIKRIKAGPLPAIKFRANILKARLKKVKLAKSGRGTHTYRAEQVVVWAKELRIIQDNPDGWSPGCVQAKKKKSAEEYIDGLNLE